MTDTRRGPTAELRAPEHLRRPGRGERPRKGKPRGLRKAKRKPAARRVMAPKLRQRLRKVDPAGEARPRLTAYTQNRSELSSSHAEDWRPGARSPRAPRRRAAFPRDKEPPPEPTGHVRRGFRRARRAGSRGADCPWRPSGQPVPQDGAGGATTPTQATAPRPTGAVFPREDRAGASVGRAGGAGESLGGAAWPPRVRLVSAGLAGRSSTGAPGGRGGRGAGDARGPASARAH